MVGATVAPPPNTVFDSALNDKELVATNIYYPGVSLKKDGAPVADGDSIYTLIDRKSGLNLAYQGDDVTAYLARPPFLRANQRDRPYVAFYNAPNIFYKSEQFASITYPYAFSMVMEFLPGQEYEGFNDGGNSGDGHAPYAGNLPPGLRMGGSDPAYFGMPNAHINFFERRLVTFTFTADTLSVDIDGILADSKPMPAKSVIDVGLDNITRWCLGVSTNNSIWNCYAMYTYTSQDYLNFVADKATINTSIINKWNVGQVNPNPHVYNPNIDDLAWSFNQTTGDMTPTFSFANCTTAQAAAVEIEWWYRTKHTGDEAGAFSIQTKFSTNQIANISELPDTGTTVQAVFYTARIPGYDEIRSATKDTPLTNAS